MTTNTGAWREIFSALIGIVLFPRAFPTWQSRRALGRFPSHGSPVAGSDPHFAFAARLISPVGLPRSGRGQGERSMPSWDGFRYCYEISASELVTQAARGAAAWDSLDRRSGRRQSVCRQDRWLGPLIRRLRHFGATRMHDLQNSAGKVRFPKKPHASVEQVGDTMILNDTRVESPVYSAGQWLRHRE